MLFIMLSAPLLANDQQSLTIPNNPEYKKLEKRFGTVNLKNVLCNYQNNNYWNLELFTKWSTVADKVIGYEYVEEQRRYFLVSIMLHAPTNTEGLDILHNVYWQKCLTRNITSSTPQGSISVQLSPEKYEEAMKVCNDIRVKLFTGRNINPLTLVKKSSNEITTEVKWSLFKGVAVISYLISSCLKKENKKKDEEKRYDNSNNSLFSFLALSDVLQKVEEDARSALEKCYPILKTHNVKSLVDDKLSWLSDRNNWILCGSVGCMALLLLCLLHNKIPYLHRTFTFVVIKHI
jgi:hypothetical protein